MQKITFLQPIDIRKVWKREDKGFTPWLADEEPLRELFAECGLELGDSPTISTEVKTPGTPRSLDILVETDQGLRVAIENQYSSADHDHLTRALVYGISLEVNAILLIAEDHRPEFREVATYLNRAALAYGSSGIPIFLVRVEVFTGDNSDSVYPRFEVVAEPDEWKAAVTKAGGGGDSAKQSLIYDFQGRLLPHLRDTTDTFKNVRPTTSANWFQGALGAPGVSVLVAVSREHTNVQIWFSKVKAQEANHAGFDAFAKYQDELSKALPNYPIDWRKPGTTAMVEVTVKGVGYNDEASEEQLKEVAEVAGVLAKHAREHLTEIKEAMAAAADELA